jgi:hypothetical protein
MENTKSLKELHEQLGIIVHNHAKIEHGLSIWISNLAYVENEIGLILTSEMPCRLRINALLGLVLFKIETYPELETIKSKIDELMSRIYNSEQQRNKYAHSSLLNIDGDQAFIRVKYISKDKGLKLIQEDFMLDDLKNIVTEQGLILIELGELFHLSKKLTKPLPRKVREAINKLK